VVFFFKKHWTKAAKILGVAFFALLMFVNLQLTNNPNKAGDIDLGGLKILLTSPSAYAEGGYSCSVGTVCPDGHTISCNGNNYCQRSSQSVTCDGYTEFCYNY